MQHTFNVVYEMDCTVGEAVAAYLDAEHYSYLHKSYAPSYKPLWQSENRIAIEQVWQWGPFRFGNSCITEYCAPACFINYELKPTPRWLPSIHHLIRTRTELRYYPSEDGQRTVSHLTVQLNLPWMLWPLRKFIEKHLTRLKIEKDQEDVDLIADMQAVFGRGNISHYFHKGAFLLHKELFMAHFGPPSRRLDRAHTLPTAVGNSSAA